MGTGNEFNHRRSKSNTESEETKGATKAVYKMVKENKRLKEEVSELEEEIKDINDSKATELGINFISILFGVFLRIKFL